MLIIMDVVFDIKDKIFNLGFNYIFILCLCINWDRDPFLDRLLITEPPPKLCLPLG